MLTRLYVNALLVDADLADQVWDKWNSGEADIEAACIACMYTGFIRNRSPFVT
jgi:hypothetical protein